MAKKLLLLSNSTNPGEGYLEYPKNQIVEFLGAIEEILFIPYAAVGFSYDSYTEKVNAALDFSVRGIHTVADPVKAVENAKAIAVGGGNTFHLLSELYNYGLMEVIQERVNSGIPYIGWSAGSNVAGPSIKTTNDMPIIEPPSFNALDLIPFQINPHYTEEKLPNHGGETRPDRINEFIAINPDIYVVGIPEGNMLRVEGTSCTLIGKGPVKIFRHGNQTQTKTESNLDFILE